MKLSIIVIGDEILIGQVTDTNSGFISRTLGPMGWETVRVLTVGDNERDIRAAITLCLADSQLVITTGGLGPTKDDITKQVLCRIFGGEMVLNNDVLDNVCQIFQRKNLQLNELTRLQAMVPSSCKVIQNRLGTAPIMWFETPQGKVLISMPGVPSETEGMLSRSVAQEIANHFNPDTVVQHRVAFAHGISESALAQRLDEFERQLPPSCHLAYLPDNGLVRLRLDCSTSTHADNAVIDTQFNRLLERLGNNLLCTSDTPLPTLVVDTLREKNLTLATAESCTGGNIAHLVTSVPGCSSVFLGSVVSYANSVKTNVLGVLPELIEQQGAVSRQVVEAMAQGVRKLAGADCAVATSGIAGPGGGTAEKPVGTVWIAAATPTHTISAVHHFPGNRATVIARASQQALIALLQNL